MKLSKVDINLKSSLSTETLSSMEIKGLAQDYRADTETPILICESSGCGFHIHSKKKLAFNRHGQNFRVKQCHVLKQYVIFYC